MTQYYILPSQASINLSISTWTYYLTMRKDVTALDLDIDYKIQIPGLGKLAEKVILKTDEREAEINLMNIIEKLEAR